MVLDKEFQDKIKSLIDECLIPHGIQTHECDKEHWKFESLRVIIVRLFRIILYRLSRIIVNSSY